MSHAPAVGRVPRGLEASTRHLRSIFSKNWPQPHRCETRLAAGPSTSPQIQRTAREVALKYYELYNRREIQAISSELIAPDCVYEDLIYQDAFRGRAAVTQYFEKIERLIPDDVLFVVEDITDGDPRRVGVRW